MDKILVISGGIGVVALVWWFFFGKRADAVETSASQGRVEIIVEGGYKPSIIKVKKGQKVILSLLRKDQSSCLEEFILPDFKISKFLPVGQKVDIEITPTKSGEFGFHCGMNMFHGKVIVE